MTNNPLVALRNLVMRDNQTVGALDGTIGHAVTALTGGGQPPAPQAAPAMAQPAQAPAFTPPVASRGPAQAGGVVDDLYRRIGGALGVTTAQAGDVTPQEHSAIESRLGAILNEVYDPAAAEESDQRARVSDFLAGLGVGFGQMSRGDAVNLSEIRASAERRQERNTALRLERARRSAAASYAMEMGDENMARAIAGGGADINTFLTARQMQQVEARANAAIVRQAQQAGYLADALDGVLPEQMVAAIRGGADPSTILRANEMRQAAEASARTQERIEDQLAFVQTLQDQVGPVAMARADVMGEPPPAVDPIMARALELAQIDGNARIIAGGSLYDYMSEARQQATALQSLSAPAGDPGQVALAQQVLADPNSTPAQRDAASVVVQTGGATPLAQAVAARTAGAPDADTTVRTQRVATLTEAFAAQNVPPEQAEFLARGIVDGRYETVQDPQTGEVTVYDRAAMVAGRPQAEAQIFPPPPGPGNYDPPSLLSAERDYTYAFGPAGVALNALNNAGEALGLGLADFSNREAVSAIRRLATAGRIASAVEVGGRPSAYLLEMFQDLETNPAQLFVGPETALIRLENQRAATVRELQQLDAMLTPGSGVSAADRSGASARRLALLPLLSDYDAIIGGLQRVAPGGQPSQDAAPVPAAALSNPILVEEAARLGMTAEEVEEVWRFLSPEDRRALLGEAE
jgi:hypothetical protein